MKLFKDNEEKLRRYLVKKVAKGNLKGKKNNFLKKKLYRFKKYNQLNFEKVIILGLFLKKEKIKKI